MAYTGACVLKSKYRKLPGAALAASWLLLPLLLAAALATEGPTRDLLDHKPHGRDEPLINRIMWKHIMVQASYQVGGGTSGLCVHWRGAHVEGRAFAIWCGV